MYIVYIFSVFFSRQDRIITLTRFFDLIILLEEERSNLLIFACSPIIVMSRYIELILFIDS